MNKQKLNKNRGTLFFSRWTRAGYGAFRSQGRQVAITTMVLAASLLFDHETSHAQVDTSATEPLYELDEVVVNGEQDPVPFSKIARIVTVITHKEIEAAPVSDLNELLEYALGTDIRQRGHNGAQADISMRGGTFDQTLVLLNGVNLTDPQTGHHNLDLPLDLNSIDRIEVLTGPAAMGYGVNAMNGAINIITNRTSKNRIQVQTKAGDYGYMQQGASVSTYGKNTSHLLTGGHKKSDGYLPKDSINNTDFSVSNLFYHGKWSAPNQQLDLQSGITAKSFGANSFYTPAYPEQFEATRTLFGSLRYSYTANSFSIKPIVYYRRHHDRFELFRNNAPDWYTSHNYHMTDVAGVQVPLLIRTSAGSFLLSVNHRYEHIFSNTLGKLMAGTQIIPGEYGTFNRYAERFHTGLQLSYTLDWQRLHLTAGLFASHYSVLKNTFKTYPGIEASYRIAKDTRILASYTEALRLPTFTDLYYNGPSNIGNPYLKPEKAKTGEIGIKHTKPGIIIQASAYMRKGESIIEWVRETTTGNNAVWQTQNLTSVDAKGINASAKAKINKFWPNFPVSTVAVNYAYVDLKPNTNGYETKYVADNLKHNLKIRIDHAIYNGFYASWGLQFQDRNGTYTLYENGSFTNEVDYKPFWTINVRAGWKNVNWNVFTEVNNLSGETYFDISNVPQPGRWVLFGAQYTVELSHNKEKAN
ncbi:MAG: TonB-dependent receptor [Salinivirgaceae bacterium]|jgi:vitamin B12 transporter|nr:TonB-dependent receptor [Salinivirgaceae bacterium]